MGSLVGEVLRWGAFLALIYLLLPIGKVTGFQEVTDHKEFKKLIKTKNNLMVVFSKAKLDGKTHEMITKVSKSTKGKGTLVKINCKDSPKLCKKLKVTWETDSGALLRHFKDGDFHKDYDRPMTEKSLTSFMLDPTGDAPWEEEPAAADVLFLNKPESLNKALKRDRDLGTLVMFYAPWCGHCKRMKPDYQAAATEVKGRAVMAAMDLNKGGNGPVKRAYNISGFPTLIYFEDGKQKFGFNGRSKAELIDFLSTPYPRLEPVDKEEAKEAAWSDEPSEVAHLTDDSFDEFLSQESSVLVMFYAPWCGHCKRMKPEYVKAAASMKEKGISGKLAAVDTTKERALGKKFDIKGFPTIVYFKDGEKAFDAGDARKEDAIVKFMEDPKEPPPPPPPEKPWSEEENEIEHLSEENFKSALKKKKHYLVMFYAPWCGHCKSAKPEISGAAEELKNNVKVKFGAVDCTQEQSLCSTFGVRGYPTFKYFSYYNKEQKDYDGGRLKNDFMQFMTDPSAKPDLPPKEASWADEPSEVIHLTDKSFDKFMAAESSVLVMFYAPWCGHCKRMKPEYIKAAATMQEKGILGKLAAVDTTVERALGQRFEIQGFPTIVYFKDGKKAFEAGDARKEEAIVNFMRNPKEPPPPPPPEKPWSDEPSEVVHLTEDSFDTFLTRENSALVMFYAPWCGHCKRMKPEYVKAASSMKEKGVHGKLAAVDTTIHRALGQRFEIRGYPTILYFKDGKKAFEAGDARKEDSIVSFMRNPQEPPPPPPPEKPWSDEKNEIEHLVEVNFKTALKQKKHYLVMFYAPWCGYCKKVKPEYSEAAEALKSNAEVKMGAVDCTQEQGLCKTFDVRGYPTFKYFSYYDKEQKDYDGGRLKNDFVQFMKDPSKKGAPAVAASQEGGEDSWSDKPGSEYLLHLHDDDFEKKLRSAEHALVVYYAPWCGHCKRMKGDYAKAALMLAKNRDLSGKSFTIAAVDATVEGKAADAAGGINGYPTIRYYKAGKDSEDYKGARKAQDFHDFLVDKILGSKKEAREHRVKNEL